MFTRFVLFAAFVLTCACSTTQPSSRADRESGELKEGCHTPLGFIPEGRTSTGYLNQMEQHGQPCQQGTLSCEDGVWSGAYIYPTCVRLAN